MRKTAAAGERKREDVPKRNMAYDDGASENESGGETVSSEWIKVCQKLWEIFFKALKKNQNFVD